MTEKLIKMVRVLAPDDTGASTADVHPSQVDACLATGWRLASDKPQVAPDDESVADVVSVEDAAKAAAKAQRKK